MTFKLFVVVTLVLAIYVATAEEAMKDDSEPAERGCIKYGDRCGSPHGLPSNCCNDWKYKGRCGCTMGVCTCGPNCPSRGCDWSKKG
uniref:U2-sicaritoxin-Li1a n=1 Tax=Loxosceles intermedia TaxID=58218 RepID=TX3_LOXIN|nr:RecName: Full=U2-sicaritoxin-Li1a; Short=U2-SCRTX-Li1a; AltName: Full=LiTx3; AltName: Full=Toxin 3; Flags: Precursor [Loxosceles intermedia]AAT85612.1 toxin 3 [Loxosceles intermedia]